MASDPERVGIVDRPVATRDRSVRALRRPVVRAWRVLRHSSAYLALVGAVEVLIVTQLLSLGLTPAPLVIALVTFAVYANDRLLDLETGDVSDPDRAAFVGRHRGVLRLAVAIAYGVGAALAALGGPVAFAIALLPGAAWLAYAVDWLRVPGIDVSRLKEVPVVNSLLVGGAWSLAVVGLPVAFADASVTPATAILLGYFAVTAFVSAEIANVRDRDRDLAAGVATLVTILGVARTKDLLQGVIGLATALVALGVLAGWFTLAVGALLAAGTGGLAVVTAAVGREVDGTTLTIIAECTRIPVFVLLTATTIL